MIQQFPQAKQVRLDELLERNSESSLTESEGRELAQLVAEAERLMVRNAQQLAGLAESSSQSGPAATPVTVWVKPQPTE